MHDKIIATASVADGKVAISASVTVPTGGYSLDLHNNRYGNVLVYTITLFQPFPGEMVTQAEETEILEVTLEIPEGVERVCVFIEPQRDPIFDFEL